MKNIIISLSLVFCINMARGQHIRKNYQEMTAMEITDYDAALQIFWNSGSLAINNHAWFAAMHNTHFGTNIHAGGGGQNFTSFHRFFLLHWELVLQSTAAAYNYLQLPYWDWRMDPPKNATPVNVGTLPGFWAYSFLPITNFSTWTGLTRPTSFAAGNSFMLPTFASYNTALGQSPFLPNFSSDLEGNNHNGPHVYISGTMGGGSSPLDPIFYSHHAMVDKIWQDWEDQATGLQSAYPGSPYSIPGYNIGHGWGDNLDANTCKDSRNIPFRWDFTVPFETHDVWYAENGKVLLDGSNGSDFFVNGNNKIYRYTMNGSPMLGGSMYMGDIYRDAFNNVQPDTKGGFVGPASNSAHFRAGGDITLLPGSAFYSGGGNEYTFGIITAPNGF
jgi:tyrosinase